jgi:hypothetical protein
MAKENLPAVLEILEHGIAIRRKVEADFWAVLKESFQKCQPSDLGGDLRWKEHLLQKERELDRAFAGLTEDSFFNLAACPKSLTDESQGLSYLIETYALCGLASVQNLGNRLRQYKCNGLELDPEPNPSWFWWAYWKKDIYVGSPGSWFSKERDIGWFEPKAKSFWDFVGQTHELVVAADELKRH